MLISKKCACLLAVLFISSSANINAQVGLKTDLNDDNPVNVSDVSYLIGIIMGKNTDDAVAEGLCPNTMHPHLIDLGLPSETKWSCCNLGAATPIEYGDYYAWGEMHPRNKFIDENYIYFDMKYYKYINLADDIAGTSWDVVSVKWGQNYAMPTQSQLQELLDECTMEWAIINGIDGMKFNSSNGNSIFLPCAGYYTDDTLNNIGTRGYYWTSSMYPNSDNDSAYGLIYQNLSGGTYKTYRFRGMTIRAVAK